MGNWTWGLSLIALTMAIHATGIAFMAFATLRIRHRMESLNRLRLHHWFAIAVPVIGVVGLLLAALHGIEAAVWAAAYWWLGALNSVERQSSTPLIRSAPAARRGLFWNTTGG